MGTNGVETKNFKRLDSPSLGFTLIEVLIALTIFSLIFSTLLWGFRQGLTTWEKASKHQQRQQSLLMRYDWLERMFNEAIVADYEYKKKGDRGYFEVAPQTFNWITTAPLLDVTGHAHPVALKWAKSGQHYGLYYREGRVHTDLKQGIQWMSEWVELFSTSQQGRFSFEAPRFPLPDDEDIRDLSSKERKRYRNKPEWLTEYDIENLWLMPQRIKIEFIDLHQQPHQWIFNLPTRSGVFNLDFYRNE